MLTLSNAKDITNFKRVRAKYKKKSLSGTIVKDRLENIYKELGGKFFGFDYLNETEKMDFMLIALEQLMIASGAFPGMLSVEQIEANAGAKAFFDKHGKWPEGHTATETAGAAS